MPRAADPGRVPGPNSGPAPVLKEMTEIQMLPNVVATTDTHTGRALAGLVADG